MAMAAATKEKVAKNLNVLPIWSLFKYFNNGCKTIFVKEQSKGFANQIWSLQHIFCLLAYFPLKSLKI